MDDGDTGGRLGSEIGDAGSAAMLRHLRGLIASEGEATPCWRDDVRLFALTWAAGFLFFMIVLA